MIMNAHQSTRCRRVKESRDPLQNIRHELQELGHKIIKKDFEAEELSNMVQSAYVTINRLNHRVSTLQEKIQRWRTENFYYESWITSVLPPIPEKTLLLGTSNLTEVRSSDLGKHCSIRTIQGAAMDLLRCWVNEPLNWSLA